MDIVVTSTSMNSESPMIRASHLAIATVVSAVLAVACSSSDSGSPGGGGDKGSCLFVGGKSCFDYPGSGYTPANIKTGCDAIKGTLSTSACATADRVGTCKLNGGSSSELLVRYYALGFTATSAQTNCTAQSGTYTPG
jgi:hypothetical protein